MQLGSPGTADSPPLGGSEFLPYGPAADQHQYIISRAENEGIVDVPGAIADLLGDPYSHFQFGSHIGGDFTTSCDRHLGQVSIPAEIMRIFQNPGDACTP